MSEKVSFFVRFPNHDDNFTFSHITHLLTISCYDKGYIILGCRVTFPVDVLVKESLKNDKLPEYKFTKLIDLIEHDVLYAKYIVHQTDLKIIRNKFTL